MTMRADIAVIGAGMAGASLAAEAAASASVVLIEAEAQPGYHATGRSAAFWSQSYGGPAILPLTAASGRFLAAPPEGFSERPFLGPRGAISIADGAGRGMLDELYAAFRRLGLAVERLDREALDRRIPGLRPGWDSGMFEPDCRDIDVAALHAAYLKAFRRRGGTLLADAAVTRLDRRAGGWRIVTRGGEVEAAIVVNAAGAWADRVAALGGVRPLGIQPFRRTIVQLAVDPPAPADLPLVIDVAGRFYFKPEAGGRLWVSPHDETPCAACDAAPEREDIALAVHRLEQAVDWRIERVERSWAGLRSFARDRLPVYGFSADAPGFFWCAGQGGFGIQTAPAGAKLAAALLLGADPDPLVAAIDPAPYAVSRFGNA